MNKEISNEKYIEPTQYAPCLLPGGIYDISERLALLLVLKANAASKNRTGVLIYTLSLDCLGVAKSQGTNSSVIWACNSLNEREETASTKGVTLVIYIDGSFIPAQSYCPNYP